MAEQGAIDLGLLEGVPVEVEAEIDRIAIRLEKYLRLQAGDVIPLPKKAGAALDLYVGGSRIGSAKVYVDAGARKIQISEVGDAH